MSIKDLFTLVALMITATNQLQFDALPAELRHRIFDALPKADMLRGIMTLNKATYRYYYLSKYHQINQLYRFIDTLGSVRTLPNIDILGGDVLVWISNQSAHLMMNEVFQLRCGHFLTLITRYPLPLTTRILHSMNMVQIAMPLLSDIAIDGKLKMLILSSRALAPVSSIPGQIINQRTYPWLRHSYLVSMTYLYEYLLREHHAEFGINPLESLFN